MLRFANPGSDIPNMVRVFVACAEALGQRSAVSLDDLVKAAVRAGLATSSGYSGEAAIERSYNPDRSRDAVYNLLKMYSELFRMLGWLHPTASSALTFRFTYFGAHVVEAGPDWRALFEEALLGIAHPSAVLGVQGRQAIRPFAAILRTMHALGGDLLRDEMIVGPLTLADDRDDAVLSRMIGRLQKLRQSRLNLSKALAELGTARRVQVNTLKNYTRFPLAAVVIAGWATDAGGGKRRLTPKGEKVVARIQASTDLRLSDLEKLASPHRAALARAAFLELLARAGFETASVCRDLNAEAAALSAVQARPGSPLLFSPYQTLPSAETAEIFGEEQHDGTAAVRDGAASTPLDGGVRGRSVLRATPKLTHSSAGRDAGASTSDAALVAELKSSFDSTGGNTLAAAAAFAQRRETDQQQQFYPLVAALFRCSGFPCEHSRAGVNYERWDARITLGGRIVNVEIKSPTEEQHVSLKAVRQALENRIVLVSRGNAARDDTTSLVAGYKPPNRRAEVSGLIEDIHKVFGVRIGVLDLTTLTFLAMKALFEDASLAPEDLLSLLGIHDAAAS